MEHSTMNRAMKHDETAQLTPHQDLPPGSLAGATCAADLCEL